MEVHRGFLMYPQKMLRVCSVMFHHGALQPVQALWKAWLESLAVPIANCPGNLSARSQWATIEVSTGFCCVLKS